MAKNELVPMDTFRIPSRYEGMDEDLLEELKDELADLDEENGISCRLIKIPSGGGLAYEVQGDEDDVEYMKEVSGVIVFTHRMNAYWEGKYGEASDEGAKIPYCSSMDGKTGLCTENGEVLTCEGCPYNQYGSDMQGGKGKACKNMRRIYLMMNNDPNFYLLTVPPTSLKEVNNRLARIMGSKGIPYTQLIVSFKLEKATNAGGIAYSKIVIETRGLLPAESAAMARQMRNQIKEKYKELAITADDYNAPPTYRNPAEVVVDDAEFSEVIGSDDEVPPFMDAPAQQGNA